MHRTDLSPLVVPRSDQIRTGVTGPSTAWHSDRATEMPGIRGNEVAFGWYLQRAERNDDVAVISTIRSTLSLRQFCSGLRFCIRRCLETDPRCPKVTIPRVLRTPGKARPSGFERLKDHGEHHESYSHRRQSQRNPAL